MYDDYGAPVPVHPTVSTAAPLHRQDTAVPVYMPEGDPSFSPGAMTQWTPGYGESYAGWDEYWQDEEFSRNFQFGIIDNGLLVAMTLAGVSLEDQIAKAVGVKGYGAIMGAAVGNAISDGAAALPQGPKAAAGVTLGCLAPVIPLAVAMAMKKEIKGTTRNMLLASSAALLLYAFTSKKLKQSDRA